MRPEVETQQPSGTLDEVPREMVGELADTFDPFWFHVTALRLFGGGAAGLGDAIERLHIRPAHRRRRARTPLWIC